MAWLSTQAPPLRGSAGQATACGGCSCQPPAAVGSNRLRRLRNRLWRLRSRLRRLRCRLRRQNLQTAISQPKMPETGNLSEDAHRKISKKKVFWFLGFIDAISGPNSIFFFFSAAAKPSNGHISAKNARNRKPERGCPQKNFQKKSFLVFRVHRCHIWP